MKHPVTKLIGHSNSILEAFAAGHGSFSRFLKIVHSKPYVYGSGPRTPLSSDKGEFKLFPSLLAVPQRCPLKSPRRRCRGRGREHTWQHVRVLWALFTFLEGGSPSSHEGQVSLAECALATPWTAEHSEYAGCLHEQVHRFSCLRTQEPLGRGLEQLHKLVTKIQNSDYKPGPYNISEFTATALEVNPDRMSLPDHAGIIDPADHLKGSELETFCSMNSCVPHDISPEQPTRACFKVAPGDVNKVYRKLLDSKVATLIPSSLALRDSNGKIVSGGLFAVPHKPASDRIICDRRPINELERRLIWARLPHGCLLTQILLPKGHSIRGSGDDLSNYFYLLKHQEDWLYRDTVGSPVSGKDFLEYGCSPNEKYILAFQVIPMGDLNAVDIAQQTHLEVLRDCGCMRPDQTLAFRSPVPAASCMEGLYIDDHVTIQVLPGKKLRRNMKGFKYRDEEIVEASRKRYQELRIPVSIKKAYTKAPSFTAWGTHVDNATGRVGTPIEKLGQLAQLLVDVCSLRFVSQKVLQKVLGLIVHPAMHRREIMCLLQESYIWVESLGPAKAKRLPNAVREELLMVALCLPLCHSNIRYPVATRIGASDASLKGGGRAATLTAQSIANTLFRFSVHRGEAVRLDWQKGQLAPPSDMTPAPPEIESLMQAHVWNTTHKCTFGHAQHINILELKMIKAELVDLVKKSTLPQRSVLLVDSAGAWAKGRSSSKQLNRVLRSMLGWSLVGQKSLHLVWVQSSMNPADHPSRGEKIPDPKLDDPIIHRLFGESMPTIQTRRSNKIIWTLSDKGVVGEVDELRGAFEPALAPTDHPAMRAWSFREIFAGAGGLTKVFKDKGTLTVHSPVELIQRGKPLESHNLLDDTTFNRLCKDACHGHQLWHFCLPSASFSILQNMNHSTRSREKPEGLGWLKKEKRGNELARRTIYLCKLLHEHGSFFTVENPKTSFVWLLPEMQGLINITQARTVEFDQCCYNLRIFDSKGFSGLVKKATKIVGTLPTLEHLRRRCDQLHCHVQVIGGVKTSAGWKRRSAFTKEYPKQFCNQYYQCCIQLFA